MNTIFHSIVNCYYFVNSTAIGDFWIDLTDSGIASVAACEEMASSCSDIAMACFRRASINFDLSLNHFTMRCYCISIFYVDYYLHVAVWMLMCYAYNRNVSSRLCRINISAVRWIFCIQLIFQQFVEYCVLEWMLWFVFSNFVSENVVDGWIAFLNH